MSREMRWPVCCVLAGWQLREIVTCLRTSAYASESMSSSSSSAPASAPVAERVCSFRALRVSCKSSVVKVSGCV